MGKIIINSRAWNIRNGNCIDIFKGHTEDVTCLDVHEGHLISGSADCTLRYFQLVVDIITIHEEYGAQYDNKI
jgi:WD40 repeat protein